MRPSAPTIVGAAVAIAAILFWYLRSRGEAPSDPRNEAALSQPTPRESSPSARALNAGTSSADATLPSEALVVETGRAPTPERAPLPGESPSTPMANLRAELQRDVPPQVAEGEREFAAEPIDAAWAAGAEADMLAKFAQMSGLRLIDLQVECRSTMCRLQLMQPGTPDGSRQPFSLLRDSVGLEPRWAMVVPGPGGSMKSVAYLWRPGFAPAKPVFVPAPAHETN